MTITKAEIDRIKEKFELTGHPEGGYFREFYRSVEKIPPQALPYNFHLARSHKEYRNISTAVYFLLESEQIHKFHKIESDELWHFYAGSALRLHLLTPDGEYSTVVLGNALKEDAEFCVVVPAQSWFVGEVLEKESYSLVGCTVAPGFDFQDFTLAEKAQLLPLLEKLSILHLQKFL